MAYIDDLDHFMPIGYSVLKRPSLQHGYLMVDNGNLSQDDFGIIQIEQSIRLSNEMYHFFGNGENILPSQDHQHIEQLAKMMNNSDSVNRGLFLEACRRHGLPGNDDELISQCQRIKMRDELQRIPVEEKILIDREIREHDFIRENGIGFTYRLSYSI